MASALEFSYQVVNQLELIRIRGVQEQNLVEVVGQLLSCEGLNVGH